MKPRRVLRVLKIGAIGTAAIAVFGFAVMSLWNWLAPAVFGGRMIDFWQALGILVLSKILFGGLHGRPGHNGPWGRRISARWEQMTPEEREKFRQGMAGRCGRGGGALEESGASEGV
jgi:hypothetical protein